MLADKVQRSKVCLSQLISADFGCTMSLFSRSCNDTHAHGNCFFFCVFGNLIGSVTGILSFAGTCGV